MLRCEIWILIKTNMNEKSNIFLIGGLIFTAANVVVGGIGNIVSGVFKKKEKLS